MSLAIEPEIMPPAIAPPRFGSSSPSVLKAIIGVMRRVREIRKEGWNSEGRYAFVYFGDVLAALQDAMVAEGLVVTQREVARAVVNKILSIKYEFDAYHADTGEAIFNIASHTGACRFEFKNGTTDDKSFNKALVAAEKTGLMALFKIPPDDHNTERAAEVDADAQGLNDVEPLSSDSRRALDRDERPRTAAHDEPPPGQFGPPPEDAGDFAGAGAAADPSNGHADNKDKIAGFRAAVAEFKRKLEAAVSEDDACEIWRDETKLIRQMADSTYEYIRSGYCSRWGIYPPSAP